MSNDYHLAGWCWRFNWPCCALKRWTYTNKVVSLSLSVCLGAGMFIGTFVLHVQWHGGKWTNLNGKHIFKYLIFIFLFHLLHHFNFEYTWNPIRCTYTKWREPLSIESVNQRLGFVQSKWICHQFQKLLNTFHLDVWLNKIHYKFQTYILQIHLPSHHAHWFGFFCGILFTVSDWSSFFHLWHNNFSFFCILVFQLIVVVLFQIGKLPSSDGRLWPIWNGSYHFGCNFFIPTAWR